MRSASGEGFISCCSIIANVKKSMGFLGQALFFMLGREAFTGGT
jgi:hypothetical protein